MNYLIPSIYIFATSIILFSFISLELSIALYASYLILVPYLEFYVAGIPLSYNLVNTVLLIAFLYHFRLKKKINLSFKIINPFLFLYISLFVLSFFSWTTPWDLQFNSWRASFMTTCFLSFILWNMALKDLKTLIYLKWAIVISITISGIYGLFLTQMEGTNPYTVFLSVYFDKIDLTEVNLNRDSRLSFSTAAKINSTMVSPFSWSLQLCLLLTIFTTYHIKRKLKANWFFIGLIGFNILTAGVRTGIAALAIGFLYFLFRIRNFKLILSTLLLLIIMSVVVQTNDDLSNLLASFTDVSGTNNSVKGSSISMRLEQLVAAIDEIKGVELVGKGFGWTNYYLSTNQSHPILLSFESLIFIVLCNSGIIGIFIWIIFFILLFRIQRNILKSKQDIFLMDTIIIVYSAYAVGTGEYGFIQQFSFYYTYLLAYLFNLQREKCNA